MTLLLDPMAELADALGQIEDWLLWSDPDGDEEAELVSRGADAAGSLCVAVRAALADAPRLLGPNRTQLALIARLPSEAVQEALDALTAAVAALPHDRNVPSLASPTLALMTRCVAQDGTADAELLAGVLNSGGSGGRWLGLEGEDETGAGDRRWTTRLDPEELSSYRRFAGAVIEDPLERFAAIGQ